MLVLFLIPLRITIKTLKGISDDSEDARRKNAKLAFFGSKIFVLVATSCVMTWIAFLSSFGFNVNWVWPIEAVLNSTCLMLMSPYYSGPKGNDELLYRTLCKPCIICYCQVDYSLVYHSNKKRKLEASMSGNEANSEKTTNKTVDTESAPRIYAEKETQFTEEMAGYRQPKLAVMSASMTPPPPAKPDMASDTETAVISDYDLDNDQPKEKGNDIELEVQ